MSAIFAKELRDRSITVNAVAPDPTATDLFYVGKSNEQMVAWFKAIKLGWQP
tara:strand:- start:1602 stop:1757 length:156 start_codon:yes stop_codon:yes gene_type:complete